MLTTPILPSEASFSPQLKRNLSLAERAKNEYRNFALWRHQLRTQLRCDIGWLSCMDGRVTRLLGLPEGLPHFPWAGGQVTLASPGWESQLETWVDENPETPNLLLNVLHRSVEEKRGCGWWEGKGGHDQAVKHAIRQAEDIENVFPEDLRMVILCHVTDTNCWEIYDPERKVWYVVPRHYSNWGPELVEAAFRFRREVVPEDMSYQELVERLFPRWPGVFQAALAHILELHDRAHRPEDSITFFGCNHEEDCAVVGTDLNAYAHSRQNLIVGARGGTADQVEKAGSILIRNLNPEPGEDRRICLRAEDRILLFVQKVCRARRRDDPDLYAKLWRRAEYVVQVKASKYHDVAIGKQPGKRRRDTDFGGKLEVAALVIDPDYHYKLVRYWPSDDPEIVARSLHPSTD